MGLTKTTYAMIEGSPVNVLDFGAVGDGTTDDTAAFTAAATYCNDNNKTLYVPDGTYVLANTITVNNIVGNGINSVITGTANPLITSTTDVDVMFDARNLSFLLTSAVTGLYVNKNYDLNAYVNLRLDNIFIYASDVNANGIKILGARQGVINNIQMFGETGFTGNGIGLELVGNGVIGNGNGAINIKLSNVIISKFANGVKINNTGNNYYVAGIAFSNLLVLGATNPFTASRVNDLQLVNAMWDSNTYGASLTDCWPVRITNGWFAYSSTNANSSGITISAVDSVDNPCRYISIDNCHFYGVGKTATSTYGIKAVATSSTLYSLNVSNCTFDNNWTGIDVSAAVGQVASEIKIYDNYFLGSTKGISFDARTQRGLVNNNNFTACTTGVDLAGNYCRVTENNFESDVTTPILDTGVRNSLGPSRVGQYWTTSSGVFVGNGNASTTTFQVAHNLGAAPNKAMSVTNGTQTTAILSCTNDANYIYVTYASAPPSGTNNVIFYWTAERAY